jgi:hypothetical protein
MPMGWVIVLLVLGLIAYIVHTLLASRREWREANCCDDCGHMYLLHLKETGCLAAKSWRCQEACQCGRPVRETVKP